MSPEASKQLQRPPVVHVVGKKKTGKTTIVVRLVELLAARGLRVGTIKHAAHEYPRDVAGTDSYRHRTAGAVLAGFQTPQGFALFGDAPDDEANFARLLGWMQGLDLVIVEGGKHLPGVKIEAFAAGEHDQPLCQPGDNCLAIVTDRLTEHFAAIFSPTNLAPLADLIQRELLGK